MVIDKESSYFKVAQDVLVHWHSFTPEDAAKFITENNRAVIEEKIEAHGSISDAALRLGKRLGLDGYQSYVLSQEMLGLTTSTAMTELAKQRVREELARRTLDEARKFSADILIDCADRTHANWTGRKSGAFFGNKDVRDKQYQYTTSDFIGMSEVKADFMFIRPMAEVLGLPVDEQSLLNRYHDVTVQNLRDLKERGVEIEGVGGPGVDTIREMVGSLDELMQGDRVKWSEDVHLAWQYDYELGNQVTREVMEKGIGKDAALMGRLVDEGILNKEDPDGLDDFGQEIGGR